MVPRFNPPPNWPAPPLGWTPPPGWTPDPSWGPAPPGWQLWIEDRATAPATALPRAEPTAMPPGGPTPTLPPVPAVPGQPGGKPWLARHKALTGIGAVVVLLIVVAALSGGNDDGDRTPVAGGVTQVTEQADEKTPEEIAAEEEAERVAEEEAAAEAEAEAAAEAEKERAAEEARLAEEAAAAEAAAAEAARIGTLSQQNAYSQAKNYLDFMPFSRAGLIGQLTSEYGGQFPPADAEFAVARLEAEGGVDWNAEAVEAAQSYQKFSPMSRQGLIDQLTSEYGSQFTLDQATYAVNTLGL